MIAKIAVSLAFYVLYWFCCFLGTGTDRKNLAGLRSYPDAVQRAVAVLSAGIVTMVG